MRREAEYFRRGKFTWGHFNQELIVIDFSFLQKLLNSLPRSAGLQSNIDCDLLVSVENALVRFHHVELRLSSLDLESKVLGVGNVVNGQKRLHLLVRLEEESEFSVRI